jgi:hypothetical protein
LKEASNVASSLKLDEIQATPRNIERKGPGKRKGVPTSLTIGLG